MNITRAPEPVASAGTPAATSGEAPHGFPCRERTFVIQLERETRRREHVRRMMVEHAFPATPVAAVDGLALTPGELDALVAAGVVEPSFRHAIAPAHLGCALSHLGVWRQVVEDDLPAVLVVEDDFVPGSDFWPRFARFHQALPAGWDLAYLNLWNRLEFGTCPLPGRPAVHAPSRILGTVGYLVSRRGAERILAHLLPLRDCVDDELDLLFRRGLLRAYAAAENLVLHHDPFPSTLYEDGDARPFRWSQAAGGKGSASRRTAASARREAPCTS